VALAVAVAVAQSLLRLLHYHLLQWVRQQLLLRRLQLLLKGLLSLRLLPPLV
jgi:hypothetical protein